MKVDAVVAMVAEILMDTAKTRWRPATHERNLNSAIRLCVDLRPDAYSQIRDRQLSAGTEQSLDAAGRYFLGVVCNMGEAGDTPGRTPRIIDADTMNAFSPNWRADAADGVVRNIIFDPRFPRRLETWPPQPNPAHVLRLLQSEHPAEVKLGQSTDFPLSDEFINPAMQFSLYLGWQKAVGGDAARAQFHYNEGAKMLGLSAQAKMNAQGGG